MENQVQQLKLNAENIRSVLISSNKTISKLRIKKKNIENKQLKLKKREEREKKIESKSSFLKSSARNIKKSIPSAPFKIFDKIMQFGFLILAGIITESLPKIIEKIKEMVKGIQEIADVIKNKVQDIFDFMTETFGDSDSPTGDYKQNREKIDKDLENIKNQAGNLEKLIPDNMQQMLMDIQSALGIQGESVKINSHSSHSQTVSTTAANNLTNKVNQLVATNGHSGSSGGEGPITKVSTTNNGLNFNNLHTMDSYNQFTNTNWTSVFGKNTNTGTSDLSSTLNFDTSTEGFSFTPPDMNFNASLTETGNSLTKTNFVILSQTNTKIVPFSVGGGSGDGGGNISVNPQLPRAFSDL